MHVDSQQKRQYLIDFVSAFCEMYVSELQFVKDIKSLILLKENLSSVDKNKLASILTQYEQRHLFGYIEDLVEYHVRVLLPALEEIFLYLPREIQELTNMELRKKRIIIDEVIPPADDFILGAEIARFVQIQMKSKKDGYEEISSNDPDIEYYRTINGTLCLDFVKNLLNTNNLQEIFIKKSLTTNYAEKIWKIKVLYKKLSQKNKLNRLNDLFVRHLKKMSLDSVNFSNRYLNIYQRPSQYNIFLNKMYNAMISYYDDLKDNSKNNLALSTFRQILKKTNKMAKKIKALEIEFSNDLTVKQQKVLEEKVGIPQLAELKYAKVKLTIRKLKVKDWTTSYNQHRFYQLFPNNTMIMRKQGKEKRLFIQAVHGRSLVKIYLIKDGFNIAVNIQPILNNIRNGDDIIEVKQLLIGFARLFLHKHYSHIELRCYDPELTRDLCSLAISTNCNPISLEKTTSKNLYQYLEHHIDKIELSIDADLQYIVAQCQHLINLGFVPELRQEAKEILKIHTMTVMDIDQSSVYKSLQMCITHINPIIAIKQVIYFLENNIGFTISNRIRKEIKKYLLMQDETIRVAIVAMNYFDAVVRLKLAIDLGLVPVIKDLTTLKILHEKVDDCYVCRGLFEMFEINNRSFAIAYNQFRNLMTMGICTKLNNNVLTNIEHKSNLEITINFSNPKAAIYAMQYALRCGFKVVLTNDCRNKIINYIITQKSYLITNVETINYQIFKFCMENALSIKLNAKIIKNIVQEVRQCPCENLLISFNNYPPDSYGLLYHQIQQIEKINKFLEKPIKFYFDIVTKSHNASNFQEVITKEMLLFFEQADILLKKRLFRLNFNYGKSLLAKIKGIDIKKQNIDMKNMILYLRLKLDKLRKNSTLTMIAKFVLIIELLNNQLQSVASDICDDLLKKLAPIQRKIDGIFYNVNKDMLENLPNDNYILNKWQQEASQAVHALEKQMEDAIESAHRTILTSYFDIKKFKEVYRSGKHKITDPTLLLQQMFDPRLVYSLEHLTKEQIKTFNNFSAEKRLKVLGERIATGAFERDNVSALHRELAELAKLVSQPRGNINYTDDTI